MKNKEWSIIHSYSRNCLKSSQDYNHIGVAGMEEWHSPDQCDLGSLPDPPSYEGCPTVAHICDAQITISEHKY